VSNPIDQLSDPLRENVKTREKWSKLVDQKEEPGAWLGRVELLIFYCGIWFLASDSGLACIQGSFKVGTL
jgi:hypothetical protein